VRTERRGDRKVEHRLEVFGAVLLAAGALATSWAQYQSASWNGAQSRLATDASAMRLCATRASVSAGQETLVDVSVFLSWNTAIADGREDLAAFYEQHMRAEFKPAFRAWLATKPFEKASASSVPFAMPQYRLAHWIESERCERAADSVGKLAREANVNADGYVLDSVMFAVMLFFAGTAQNARSRGIRLTLLAIACLTGIVGIVRLCFLPRG